MQKLSQKILVVAVCICLLSACTNKVELFADIKCNNCAIIIENDLQETEGVKKVNANMEKQIVIVKYDKKIVSEQQLKAVLNKTIEKFGAYDMSKCGIAHDCKKCCIEPCCKVVTGKTTCKPDSESNNGKCCDSGSERDKKCCDSESKSDKECCADAEKE
jgi:copper chaperone CopZ